MISLSHLYEKSLLLAASALVWAAIVPSQPLVIASPLVKSSLLTSPISNSPIESKSSDGTESPSNYEFREAEVPNLEMYIQKLLSRQPQVRMVKPSLEDRNSESEPISSAYSSKDEPEDSYAANRNVRLGKLLLDYFRTSDNRLPRRIGATSKRAAAMGVDLPDYILHMNKGRNFDFSTFREKLQKSG